MLLYLIRHGEFIGNTVDYDMADGSLTELGQRQALALAQRLSGEGLTHIIASPLFRGLETAQCIAEMCDMRYVVWKNTYEWRQKGKYVGPSVAELSRRYSLADFESDMEEDGWICEGVETADEARTRARIIINRLVINGAGIQVLSINENSHLAGLGDSKGDKLPH